ncbi:MAG: hypothetical protein HKO89_02105, partial [Saprospiraceae bacterium]|nr:hypothetical protein [Saprospiraceae bacterium]
MSKTTKIFVYPILTALMMLFNFTIVNGTHIVGGELTYKCLGNNEYEVTLIVRRDCENGAEDAPFDDPAVVGVFDIFGALQLHLGNLGEMELPFMGEDTVSNEIVFDCGALGGPVCVHEAVYRDTITLPWNKIGYILAYQRCCRNSILNNITEPLETGATYYSRVEAKALEECNSQPVFQEWPDVYICVNEELVFDHAAIDQDGDQLVYKLCTPMAGATIDHPKPTPPGNPPYSTIEWLSPFNLNNLMGGDALEIDAQTGIITAKPNAIGTYLIGICVEEYRDGILLSTVRRDFEYNVRACTEPIAVDFEVEGLDCDLSISCTNLTEGADEYTWYFDYPNTNPQFISNDENPAFTYRENGIYTIRLEGKRNADGCTTYIDKTVTISDIPMVADFTSEFGSCEGGNMLSLTDQSYDTTQVSHAVEWEWIVEIDGVSTTYTGNPVLADVGNAESANITLNLLSSAGCESFVQKDIDLGGLFPHADFTVKLLECVADGYALEVEFLTDTDTFEIDSIKWLVTDGGVDMSYDGESFNFTSNAENLFIRMTVNYSNGCEKIVERDIDATSFLPVLIISNDLNADCIEGDTTSINFFAELTGGNMDANPVSYTWNINGSPYSSDETITLEVALGDTVDISLVILYDNNCTFEANDQFVFEQGNMLAGFDADLDCKTIVDFNSTGLNVDEYLWYFDYPNADQGFTSTEANPSFDYEIPGVYTVRLEATRLSDSCMAIEEKVITVSDIPMIPDFDVAFESCENGRFIRLQDLSYDTTGISHAVDVTWEVNYNGITEILHGDNYILNIQNADEITVALTVVSSAGCTSNISESIDLTEVFPGGDILTTLLQCVEDGYLLDIAFVNSDSSYTIESILWTIDDGGTISTQTGSSFQITSDAVDLSVMLVVNYTNGCVFETEQEIKEDDFLPILSIGYDQNIDCTGPD